MLIISIYLISSSAFSWDSSDFYNEISSPIQNPHARTAAIIGSSVLGILLIFEDSIIDPTQEEAIETNSLGSSERTIQLMGEVVPNAIYSLGMLGSYYFFKDKDQAENLESAEVMLKASAYAALVTNILKYTIRQKRPASEHRDSFPSGHTTMAFAFASVIAQRHQWYFGVPAYLLAGLVGFQRMNGNNHYLHDVVAGATIGTAFGIGINSIISDNTDTKNLSMGFLPFGKNHFGMILSYQF